MDVLTSGLEFSGLSIDDNPDSFYDEEPPPPKITSEGVITTNITEKFVAAAKSLSSNLWSLVFGRGLLCRVTDQLHS